MIVFMSKYQKIANRCNADGLTVGALLVECVRFLAAHDSDTYMHAASVGWIATSCTGMPVKRYTRCDGQGC